MGGGGVLISGWAYMYMYKQDKKKCFGMTK